LEAPFDALSFSPVTASRKLVSLKYQWTMDADLHWLAGLAEILLFPGGASKPDFESL
jgi:hypothetical protein